MRWLTTRNNNNLSLNSIKNEMDSFFDNFFDLNPASLSETAWIPKIDLSEDDKNYFIKAEMPGLSEKDINITLENYNLTIAGEKSEESKKEDKKSNYILKERRFGSFQRSIKLPKNIKTDNVIADFKNGILSIEIPKEKSEEAKKVDIKIN